MSNTLDPVEVLSVGELSEDVTWLFDNSCHFVNIQAYPPGDIVWLCTEQAVYTPIYGVNIHNDPNLPPRDISHWQANKLIVKWNRNVSADIWVGSKEVITHVAPTNLSYAKCNLITYWRYPSIVRRDVDGYLLWTLPVYPYNLPPELVYTDNETFVSVSDTMVLYENILIPLDNPIPNFKLKTSIHAQLLYGWDTEENGECPYITMPYLCDGRGFKNFIGTIWGSSQNRWRTNINLCIVDTANKIYNTLNVINVEDPWYNPITHEYRQLKKQKTNIRAWKPLKYSVRVAPAEFKSFSLEDLNIVTFKNKNIYIPTIEIPLDAANGIETATLDFIYSENNTNPPANISFTIVGVDQTSIDNFSKFNLKWQISNWYKIPICIFSSKQEYLNLELPSLNREYQLDTFGWGMKSKIKIVIPPTDVERGIYLYTFRFKIETCSTFNECVFGDYYGSSRYIRDVGFQINVR